jgi:hypothetical protein
MTHTIPTRVSRIPVPYSDRRSDLQLIRKHLQDIPELLQNEKDSAGRS